MPTTNAELVLMETAARAAGKVLSRYFAALDTLEVLSKGPADFVSRADVEAEAAIQEVLMAGRPDAAYRGEESDYQPGSSALEWVVDPLDGTTNFLCGVPHFSVSIALREAGRTIRGLIFQPLTGEVFCASEGEGASHDGASLRASPRRKWESAVLATGVPHRGSKHHHEFAAQLAAVRERVGGIRRFGSAALDLAWVGCGRFDGFWEQGLKPWDVAAGVLIVREAGGLATGLLPEDDADSGTGVVAAHPWMHEELAALLRAASLRATHT